MFEFKEYLIFNVFFLNHWSHITSLAAVGLTQNSPNNYPLGDNFLGRLFVDSEELIFMFRSSELFRAKMVWARKLVFLAVECT